MNEKERAAMQQALEALYEETAWFGPTPKGAAAITNLRAALAQEQPEPSGYCTLEQLVVMQRTVPSPDKIAIYTAPPKAEPVQEPVAGVVLKAEGRPALVDNGTEDWHCKGRNARRLYTAPPQRPPLTDEEIAEATAGVLGLPHEIKAELARAIERKVRGE